MATTDGGAGHRGDSQAARAAGAAAALLLAAAVLAAASDVKAGDTDFPSAGEVTAGKVSVLGDAKVRRWTAQTFWLEVPIAWAPIRNPERTSYTWVLPQPGTKIDKSVADQAADANWENAQKLVQARIKIEPVTSTAGARLNMRRRGELDAATRDGFIDSGAFALPRPNGKPGGRYVWRLEIAVPGIEPGAAAVKDTVEGHYYFSTCNKNGGDRRETFHVTLNRSPLQGQPVAEQKARFQRMMSSIRTNYDASPLGRRPAFRDCATPGT